MLLLLLLLLRSWTNSSLCSLSTSAGVMDLQRFLCWRVTLLLLLSKTFCRNPHTNDLCLVQRKKQHAGKKIIRNVLTLSNYSNKVFFFVSLNNTKKDHGGAFFF